MAVCWFLCLAVFSYLLSAERVADKRLLHEADSFLTRRHGAREFEEEAKQTKETSNGTRTEAKVGLPKCSDGILQLDGVYEVKKQEEVLVEGPSCRVTGSAELLLWAPVRFQGNLVLAGQLNVKAAGDGGRVNASCITIEGNFTLHPEARLSIEGCKNQADKEEDAGEAGCLYVIGDAELLGGQLILRECDARKRWGGGMGVKGRLESRNATIEAERCTATYGGAIAAWNMDVSGGNVTITESEASAHGGAIDVANMHVSGGGVSIKESKAKRGDGGCIHTWSDFTQSGGAVSLAGCKASRGGGGICSRGNITIEEMATLTIGDSQADRGGGILTTWIHNKARRLQVFNCSAASHGGCVYVRDGAELAAPLSLRGCKAKGTGGAIYAQGKLVSQQISCTHCHAPTSACLHLESGEANIASLMLHSGSSLVPASPNVIAAGDEAVVTLDRVDCSEVPGCTLAVAQMQLARLLCQRGESRQSLADDDGTACRECATGQIRLGAVDKEDPRCTPCPNMGNLTIGCTSTELRVPPGYMVDFDRDVDANLSAWYRCPNEMACRGGHFNASSVPGARAEELVPMCEEGYRGPGCTSCTEGHARADADVLQCIPCANWTTSPKQVVWYVSFFLLKNLALFVSAVVSVEGSGGKRAASATLLNQAMSFAAVAGVTMSGAMQTGTFKNDLNNAAKVALHLLAVPASVAQGQGSSDGGSSSMSGQCLLQLLNMDSGIHNVHMLMSLWPALLVASLAVLKGGWLAAVVGSNVFLPAFIAGFGKYLVAFRLRPESENEALHLDFLPPGPQMSSHVPLRIAAVLGAIVGFSALSVCSWIYTVRTRSPKETRPHVAYLIQAYRPECAIWEVERLMRKVVLSLIATVLPVTLSPALQMEAVTLVLIASLVAHLYFWPYQADDWNRAEIGLLFVSLTITGMTTCLIANDLHWAKSTLTQRVLVFLICSIAGGICIVMLVTFALAYLAERRQRAEAKKAEEASATRSLSPRREAAAEPRAH